MTGLVVFGVLLLTGTFDDVVLWFIHGVSAGITEALVVPITSHLEQAFPVTRP
ncbi:hypothetical protein [Cellulomonas shaoxiangyii]|uniref:hypothetical protein n=1 Tax=Cellulomonas shaoxiangyii TaxID=2566013 RepID=UPI00140B414F|nr:hypothetical protein [Cellulomonas shaoxiangyii]